MSLTQKLLQEIRLGLLVINRDLSIEPLHSRYSEFLLETHQLTDLPTIMFNHSDLSFVQQNKLIQLLKTFFHKPPLYFLEREKQLPSLLTKHFSNGQIKNLSLKWGFLLGDEKRSIDKITLTFDEIDENLKKKSHLSNFTSSPHLNDLKETLSALKALTPLIEVNVPPITPPTHWSPILTKVFQELLQNSLTHGHESSAERRLVGKEISPQITLTGEVLEDRSGKKRLLLRYQDDGRGLHEDVIKKLKTEKTAGLSRVSILIRSIGGESKIHLVRAPLKWKHYHPFEIAFFLPISYTVSSSLFK